MTIFIEVAPHPIELGLNTINIDNIMGVIPNKISSGSVINLINPLRGYLMPNFWTLESVEEVNKKIEHARKTREFNNAFEEYLK